MYNYRLKKFFAKMIIVLLMMFACVPVYAGSISECKYIENENIIYIEGQTEIDRSLDVNDVSIMVLNNGKSIKAEEDVTKENIMVLMNQLIQVTPEINGKFSLRYDAETVKGTCPIVITFADGEVIRTNVTVAREQDKTDFVSKANLANTFEEMEAVLKDYDFLINKTDFETDINVDIRKKINSVLAEEYTFSSVEDFNKKYEYVAFVIVADSLKDENKLCEFIGKYFAIAELEKSDIYSDVYSVLDETGKKRVCGVLTQIDLSEDINKKFYRTVLLDRINNIDNFIMLSSKLTSGKTTVELMEDVFAEGDFAEYKALGEKAGNVLKKLVSKGNAPYSTAEDMINCFNRLVAAENSPGTGGGSGGGGSSGGSGGGNSGVSGGRIPSGIINSVTPASKTDLFSDIADVSWAKTHILNLTQKGILNGKADGLFMPYDCVTRAEFAKMLVLAVKSNTKAGAYTFDDVPQGHWAYEYVMNASSNGFVNGFGNGLFGADEKITRQDMAVMAYRAFGAYMNNGEETADFKDSQSISDYAADAVNALYNAGVMQGNENRQFMPKDNATRAEAAKIISILLEIKGE